MIAHVRGKVFDTESGKDFFRATVDVNGVGYEVLLPRMAEAHVSKGQDIFVYVEESVTAYDGATTLYGFLSKEERGFFRQIRDKVDGMGPRKALECLDKINKSLPDFKRAILSDDKRILVSVFGFTKKTAEKLVFALKGPAADWEFVGEAKWAPKTINSTEMEVLSGLINLGYREEEAREALQKVESRLSGKADTGKILQEALRLMGTRLGSS